jgi:septal ring factor EnvC (AmiA/AmiB activator)
MLEEQEMVNQAELMEELTKKKAEMEERISGQIESTPEDMKVLQNDIEQLELALKGVSPRKQRRTAFLDECAG